MDGGVRIEHDQTWELPLRFDDRVDPARPLPGLAFEAPSGILGDGAVAVLRALVEVSVASIALSRLGIPRSAETVSVRTSGPLPASCVPILERILYMFMWSRGRRAGQPPRDVQVSILPSGNARPIAAGRLDPRSAVLGFSGGLDSTACLKHLLESRHQVRSVFYSYYMSPSGDVKGELAEEQEAATAIGAYLAPEARGEWTHRSRAANILPLDSIPFETVVDDLDNDPWPFYGRNFLTAVVLLWEAVATDAGSVALGVTAEDMFATETAGSEELYSDCCQSAPFFSLHNSALSEIFEGEHPVLVAPLLEMHKGSVAGYLARDPGLLARTRSCINDGRTEDGTCFSCFDKITGILSAFPPDQLDLRVDDGVLLIVSKGMELARFCWLATNSEGDSNERYSFPDASAAQLRRLLAGSEAGGPRLWHSKFNPAAILGMLHNLRDRRDLIGTLYPGTGDRELIARVYGAIDADDMASLAGPWAKPRTPHGPSEAAGRLEALVDWRLVPQSRKRASTSPHSRPLPRP